MIDEPIDIADAAIQGELARKRLEIPSSNVR
jgi:hypothetical protein